MVIKTCSPDRSLKVSCGNTSHSPSHNANCHSENRLADDFHWCVVRGVVGSHFVDDVLSWHRVNGEETEDLLPAILITTRNPHTFKAREMKEGESGALVDALVLEPISAGMGVDLKAVYRSLEQTKSHNQVLQAEYDLQGLARDRLLCVARMLSLPSSSNKLTQNTAEESVA